MTDNQNPEQKARDNIDALLAQAGWSVQSSKKIDFNIGIGQAVREYKTDFGPADYVLFIDKVAVGVIEAKREDLRQNLTAVEQQTEGYALAKIKWLSNIKPLPKTLWQLTVVVQFSLQIHQFIKQAKSTFASYVSVYALMDIERL